MLNGAKADSDYPLPWGGNINCHLMAGQMSYQQEGAQQ
jgi:hypothetical protein